jgi:hypothetical protein
MRRSWSIGVDEGVASNLAARVGVTRAVAMLEIERRAVQIFPGARQALGKIDDASHVLVTLAEGLRPVALKFSKDALDRYRRHDDAARTESLRQLSFICTVAFATEYSGHRDTQAPFEIDVEMALGSER